MREDVIIKEEEIRVEDLGEVKKRIVFNVGPEKVSSTTKEFLKGIKHEAEIPGFRKGKANVNQLQNFLGERVRTPVSNSLIQEYYAKALKEHNLNPVGEPVLEDQDADAKYLGHFNEDNSFHFSLVIETLPVLNLVNYDNIKLDLPTFDVNELVKQKVESFQQQFAEKKQVEREAKPGDMVVIDFTGYLDNKPFEGGSADNFTIQTLGSDSMIPGFEEQIVEMKADERKTISVKFPDEYPAAHLAGQNVEFDIKMNSVIEVTPAELDNDLALMSGFSDVDEMNFKVEEDAKKVIQAKIRQVADPQIINHIIEHNSFAVPERLVEDEKNRLMKGVQEEQNLPDNFEEQVADRAKYNIKRAIILETIYEKEEETNISPDELSAMLEDFAKQNDKTKDELVSLLYNNGQMDSVVGILKNAKTLDYLITLNTKEEANE